MSSVPQEVESIFKRHNFATDNLSLSKMGVISLKTEYLKVNKAVYDVYRNDSRQPWKLNEHRIVKLRPVAFLATNTEVRKKKKICQEHTEKGQFFSCDSSNWWLVKLTELHPFTLQYKWRLAFHKYFSHFGRNKTLKLLLHIFDQFMEGRDVLDETVF